MISRSIAQLTSAETVQQLSQTGNSETFTIYQEQTILKTTNNNVHKSTESCEFYRGTNWYWFLVPREGFLSLMDEYSFNLLKSMFIVCFNIPRPGKKDERRFSAFPSCTDFFNYIIDTPPNHWYFFEIILGEQKQKLYFDIDIKKNKLPEGYDLNTFSALLLNSLIENICSTLDKYGIKVNLESELLLFSSNSDVKYSYHIILNNYAVNDCKCNTILVSEILDGVPAIFKPFIDDAVYSKKQQLRLFKSQKPNSNRVKELVEEYTYGIRQVLFTIPISFNNEKERLAYIFRASCVTDISHCKSIPIYSTDDSSSAGNLFESGAVGFDIDEPMLKRIVSKIDPVLFKIYKIVKVLGSMILLNRIAKAHCTMCNRVHENENAFITVSSSGKVYFNCRRDKEHSKLLFVLEELSKKLAETHAKILLERGSHLVTQIQSTAHPENPVSFKTSLRLEPSIHQQMRLISSGLSTDSDY